MFGAFMFGALPVASVWPQTLQRMGRYATVLSANTNATLLWSRGTDSVLTESPAITILRADRR